MGLGPRARVGFAAPRARRRGQLRPRERGPDPARGEDRAVASGQGAEKLHTRAAEIAPSDARAPTIPDDHVVVLYGATGDLARRKLLPGLFHLAEAGLMPERFRIIGTTRQELADDDFRALAKEAV